MEDIYACCTLGAAFFNAATQIILVRYFRKGLFASVCYGFFFGLAGCLLGCIRLSSVPSELLDVAGLSLISISTYSVMSYCYFHFVNLGETGRRIRLLREISTFSTPPTVAQLVECYGACEIYERRIERLIQNQQIRLTNGRYVIGQPSMSLISDLMSGLRWLVFGKEKQG